MSARLSPSGEARRGEAALVLLIAATLAVRLIVAAGVHLTEDEAYYRLWSMRPALGYFDHPPMIAWWVALGRRLLGDTALGVRLLSCLGSAASTALVFAAVRLAGGGRGAALGAAILFNATLLVGVGGVLATPDAPASLFWLASLCAGLAAVRRGVPAWWLACGALAGLCVLSKYSGLFLWPGLILWLLLSREGRPALGTPWPWAGAALGLLIFAPNIAWNATHGWETFGKQFGRVTGGRFEIWPLALFVVGQFALANPLIAWLAMRGARRVPMACAGPFFLSAAPFALYLAFHSLHARVEAHWPAPLYASIAALAGMGAAAADGAKGVARAGAVLGFGLTLLADAWLLLPAERVAVGIDPALPVRGWAPFARSLERTRVAGGAAWIGTESYGLASELATERALGAPVVELKERRRYLGLGLPRADPARPGLIVDLPRRLDPATLDRCFAFVRSLGEMRRGDGGGPAVRYRLFLVAGPRADLARAGCPS